MITRAHIRRQLRKNGGIMSAVPRQGYFLGGVGRSIGKAVGKVGDVVKQITKSDVGKAALLGAGVYKLGGGAKFGGQGFNFRNIMPALFGGGALPPSEGLGQSTGLLSKFIPKTTLGKVAAAGALATGAALTLPSEEQRKVSFLNERGGDVEGYLRQYYKNYYQSNWQEGWTQDEEDEFVAANTAEYSKGGRVGLYAGGPPEVMEDDLSIQQFMQDQGIDAGAKSIKKEGDHTLMASETNPMAELYQVYLNLLETDQIPKATTFEMFIEMVQQNQESPQARAMAAKGGRIKYGIGDLVKGRSKMVLKDFFNDEEEFKNKGGRIGKNLGGMGLMGLPGTPRMAPDGLEYDMRAGGFQPLGAKEGKDDVKANLAKNEFVMTADAVRGAGNGSVELGAQKMYDTMKRLENKVA